VIVKCTVCSANCLFVVLLQHAMGDDRDHVAQRLTLNGSTNKCENDLRRN